MNIDRISKLGRIRRIVPNSVSSRVGRQVLVAQKHSPKILFGTGIVFGVATVVTACRATLKADDIIQEHQKMAMNIRTLQDVEYSEKDRSHDMTLLYVKTAVKFTKLYAPSVALGVLSVVSLTGSHKILSKRNAAVTAAYATLEKGYADYRERVIAELGEDKDREFRFGVLEETNVVEHVNGPKKVKTKGPIEPSGYARFFDEFNPNWENTPEYNISFLKGQQMYANDRLQADGWLSLNDVYESLGMERTKAGQVVGWVKGKGSDRVDFGIFKRNTPEMVHDFMTGRERQILLDFNVLGVILDHI